MLPVRLPFPALQCLITILLLPSFATALFGLPVIVRQPAGGVVGTGQDLQLSVEATGMTPLLYQWHRDGAPLAGETGPVLWLRNATPADAGDYHAVVSDDSGNTNSSIATVEVVSPSARMWTESQFLVRRSFHDNAGGVFLIYNAIEPFVNVWSGQLTSRLVRLNESTGEIDATFKWDDRNGTPTTIAVRTDNGLYVGVMLGEAEGGTIVKVDVNGVRDASFAAPVFDRMIRYLTLQSDGKLLVAFDSVKASAIVARDVVLTGSRSLYRLDANGALDATFAPLDVGYAVTLAAPPQLDALGRIYLCNLFGAVQGHESRGLVRFSTSGAIDTGYPNWASAPPSFGPTISSFIVQPDGAAVLAGRFSNVITGDSGNPVVAVRFTAEGNFDSTFQHTRFYDVFPDAYVSNDFPRAIVAASDGGFALVGRKFARFSATGALVVTASLETSLGFLLSRSPSTGRYFVPGGNSGGPSAGVRVFEANGTVYSGFAPGTHGRSSVVNDAIALNDGRVLVGGLIGRSGVDRRPGTLLLDRDGQVLSTSTPFHDSQRTLYDPSTKTIQWSDGSFMVHTSGRATLGGGYTYETARFSADGVKDFSWNGYGWPLLEPGPGGSYFAWYRPSVYTAYSVSTSGGATLLRRYNAAGELDSSFQAELPEVSRFLADEYANYSADIGALLCIRAASDGGAYVAIVTHEGHLRIVRLRADGSRDPAYNSPVLAAWPLSASSFVFNVDVAPFRKDAVKTRTVSSRSVDIVVLPDGGVFVTGMFAPEGRPQGIARLNPDGSFSASFTGSGLGLKRAGLLPAGARLARDAAGRIYLAGRFDTVNGHPASGLVRFAADGTLDRVWHPGFEVTDELLDRPVLLAHDGWLHVFGQVRNFGRTHTAEYLRAPLDPLGAPALTGAASEILVAGGAEFVLNADVSSDVRVQFQWLRDGRPIPGANAASLRARASEGDGVSTYAVVAVSSRGSTVATVANVTSTTTAAPLLPAGGYNFAAFARLDGSIWAMGRNQEGQLGDGTNTARLTPVLSTTNAVALAAGADHLAVLKTDGTLWTTGYNPYGALGDGGSSSRSSFAPVATGVSRVAAGVFHTLFTKADGTLWAAGWNAFGQLGDGTTVNRPSPVPISTRVTALAGSYAHSLFVRSDGTLWAMGTNGAGQFGNGTTTASLVPLQVGADAREVAAGYYHSLVIDRTGTLLAAGHNGQGQLGDGTTVSRTTWVPVATGVIAAAAGVQHSVYLKADGTLWAMGANERGQLGTGDTTARATPVQIANGVSAVSAGLFTTYFTKADGTLWAAGANDQGQLGDGTTTDRANFVQIATGGLGLVLSNLQATATNSSAATHVTLTWPHALSSTHYRVLRGSTTDLAAAVPLAERVTGTFFEDLSAVSGFTYYYWIQAVNPLGTLGTGPAVPGRHGVALVPPSITFISSPRVVTLGDDTAFTVMAEGSQPLFFQWRKEGVDIVNATGPRISLLGVTLADAGSYTVVVSNPAGSVTSDVTTLTVNRRPQTIAFDPLPDRTYTTAPLALAATATSGQPVAFTLVSGPAILQGTQLTLTGPGTVVLRTTQSGDDTYDPAPQVERSFSVGKAAANVSLASLSATYDGSAKSAAATTTPADLPVVLTYDGAATAPTNAGSYNVSAIINHALYEGSASGTLVIAAAAQTITFAPLANRAFSFDPVPLSATSSSGLSVNFTLVAGAGRIEGTSLLLDAPGAFTLRATQQGNGNYSAAPAVEQSFTVMSSLDSWALEHFSAEELLNPAISGPNADPDGDGLRNLLEYALGLDPKVPSLGNLPAVGRTATHWTFTYTRPAAREDVTYVVESSTNLTSWSTANVTLTRLATGETETWQATVPTSAGNNLFFRLRVTR